MLFYLDNWQSIGPNSEIALYGPGGQRMRRDRYGRRFRYVRVRPKTAAGLNETTRVKSWSCIRWAWMAGKPERCD